MGMPNIADNLRMCQKSSVDTTEVQASYDSQKIRLAKLLGQYLQLKVTPDTLYMLEHNIRNIYAAAL